MKFVVYLDGSEIFIATPKSEEDLLRSQFSSKIIRDIDTYQRIALRGDWLCAAVYDGITEDGMRYLSIPEGEQRLGIESNYSRNLHLSNSPVPLPKREQVYTPAWLKVLPSWVRPVFE